MIRTLTTVSRGAARPVRASRPEPMRFEQALNHAIDSPPAANHVRLKMTGSLSKTALRSGMAAAGMGAVALEAQPSPTFVAIAGNLANWSRTASLAVLRGSGGVASGLLTAGDLGTGR